MQHLLTNDNTVTDSMKGKVGFVPLWSRSGPLLLLCAFAIFLFKAAPFYWPLTLTAFLGYAATRLFKLSGLFLSLMALVIVSFFSVRSGPEALWTLVLTGSIASSLVLIYLGGKDAESIVLGREQKIQALEESIRKLEKQQLLTKTSLAEDNKKSLSELQRLNALHSETSAALNLLKQSLKDAEHENKLLIEKCATLSRDSITQQNNAIALYHSLEDSKAQLEALKAELVAEQMKNQTPKEIAPSIIQQEEVIGEELVQLEQVQSQYALLRQQFEEKSEALHLARKELFKVENDYLALQKTCDEKAYDSSEEDLALIKDLEALEAECRDLEGQVANLQDFISSLLTPKKRPGAKKKKDLLESEEDLPALLQKKISRNSAIVD